MSRSGLSLLIPSYNHAKYVGQALDSVFSQTLCPDEVIVVDDGSTDGTLEVLEGYADRARILARPHRGIGETYNEAVQEARCELIAFLESDDSLEPGYLEQCVRFLERNRQFSWVSAARRIVDASGGSTGRIVGKRTPGPAFTTEGFLLKDMGTSWTPVVAKEALQRVGPFVTHTHAADSEMALRFSLHFGMGFLNRPLYRYRRHDSNISGAALRDTRELLEILRRFSESETDYVKKHEKVVRCAIAKMAGRVGSLMLIEEAAPAHDEVLALFREAVHNDPLNWRHLRRYITTAALGTRLTSGAKRWLGRLPFS